MCMYMLCMDMMHTYSMYMCSTYIVQHVHVQHVHVPCCVHVHLEARQTQACSGRNAKDGAQRMVER